MPPNQYVPENIRDLQRQLQRLLDRKRTAAQPLGKRLALDELEREEAFAVGFLEPVDDRNVRMIDGREQPRFALEAREAVGVAHERLGQRLDRDLAAELRLNLPV